MSAPPTPLERLEILINSSSPIVIIESVEEERALALVRQAATHLSLPLFEWSIADGLVRTDVHRPATSAVSPEAVTNILNTREAGGVLAHMMTMTIDAIFVLKDFHRHLEDAVVVRRLREVAQNFCQERRMVVITSPSLQVPVELANQVEYLELPLPDSFRLRAIIEEVYTRLTRKLPLRRKIDEAALEAMASNLRGLTEEEAERAVAHSVVARNALTPEIVTDVLDAKKDLLRRSGMLEFIPVTDNMSAVGGLENLKHWLARRRGTWEPEAQAAGLDAPRGVIILGVQGCGKSLCARAIAGDWKLPLVRFDTAAIFDKFIGETEKRIIKVFRVAEQLAPCVLWIDELEKVFAGSGPDSASVDAGVSSRILASFLSWMQDRKAPVFVAATCNNVSVLPPELIRKGRFDELFFVDLPSAVERRSIFSVQFAKRKLNAGDFDVNKLLAATQGFSGAEIEAAIKSAL